jgi:hypothetical protein
MGTDRGDKKRGAAESREMDMIMDMDTDTNLERDTDIDTAWALNGHVLEHDIGMDIDHVHGHGHEYENIFFETCSWHPRLPSKSRKRSIIATITSQLYYYENFVYREMTFIPVIASLFFWGGGEHSPLT